MTLKAELRRLGRAFRYAGRGVAYVWRTQSNARWHGLATVVVIIAAYGLRVRGAEAAALALAVGLVWAMEALNTAVEALADRCTRERDPLIAAAKDAAAGAVLLAALAAVVVAALIFIPRLGR
ncbi:MAG: diacylglycerol kinase family protein [Chloroflexi bacterium]|nr:diacylglycerol kinase family protein [Chloroflexota bacterium]